MGRDVQAGQRHRFVVRGQTIKLTLYDRRGVALANRRYELAIGGITRSGALDSSGKLVARVPATAHDGTLRVLGDRGPLAEVAIRISEQVPPDEDRGLRRRLRHLGYLMQQDHDDAAVARAVETFQRAHGLDATGTADAATLARLRERHGS